MSTITFRVTDEEKAFIQFMAAFSGVSLSVLARTKLIESLEDQIDLSLYEQAMKAYQLNDENMTHQNRLKELGL